MIIVFKYRHKGQKYRRHGVENMTAGSCGVNRLWTTAFLWI
jgi:hypothetical protein